MSFGSGSDELLEKGIALLRANNPLGALAFFEKAYSISKTPVIQSYLGLCIATERGKVTDAIALCGEAIHHEPQNPIHYLNLGKVYLKAKQKAECLDILRQGLAHGDDPEIRALLEDIGMRKPPFFAFLSRGHILNKYIGLLLHRLRMR
jgi:tetratricopeptide (TPR) repeat protein